jgi:hypothetical protein
MARVLRWLGLLAAAVLVAVAVVAVLSAGGTESGDGGAGRWRRERPAPAEDFAGSVGVNIHSTYWNTTYAHADRVLGGLRDLRIRHVRDGLDVDQPAQRDILSHLARHHIGVTFIVGSPQRDAIPRLDGPTSAFLAATADAIEGPNEYDLSGDPEWASHLRAYQERLLRAVRDDPELARRPVIGPSLARAASRAQVGDLSAALDVANIHPYPGGGPPEEVVADEMAAVQSVTDRKPVVVTETGYHNARAAGEGQPPSSERAAAIYLPRLLLEDFRLGVRRTFIYELLDQWPDPAGTNPDAHFGLMRSDFSAKPSYRAVRALLHILSGPGGAGAASPLAFSLSASDAEVHHVVLAGGGRTYLALWRPVRVWDEVARKDLDPDPLSVRVHFRRAPRTVDVFRPTLSSRPVAHVSARAEISVELSGDVALLRLGG